MSGILSRNARGGSIGIVVDDRRIAICVLRVLGARAAGPVARDVHDRGEEPAAELLGRVLQPWIRRPRRGKRAARGPWVQVGIPDAHAFQAVVPITQANRNATAQSYFLEAVQATNVRAEDRIIDLVRLELEQAADGLRGRLADRARSPT